MIDIFLLEILKSVLMCCKTHYWLGNCFSIFAGISLSWVAFFYKSLNLIWISSEVTDVKKKAASLSTLDTTFLIIEILECLWYFLIAFSPGSEMLEVLQNIINSVNKEIIKNICHVVFISSQLIIFA